MTITRLAAAFTITSHREKALKITTLRWALLGLAVLGCRNRPAVQTGASEPVEAATNVILPLAQLYVLEASGAPAEDTVAAFLPGGPRTVLIRHAPPDNTVFAELSIPDSALPANVTDSIRITVEIRPGVYGLSIVSSQPLGPSRLTFRYPVHFAAPSAASQKYGNAAMFERALLVAAQEPDGRFRLLPSTRPAADNLSAAIPGAGVYLVAAPR